MAIALVDVANAENRPEAAVRLFEETCVSIVQGTPLKSLIVANGATRQIDTSANTAFSTWHDPLSGFDVEFYERADGSVTCVLLDQRSVLALPERELLESLVSKVVRQALPMLREEPVPYEARGVAYLKAWMVPRYRSQNRWGVMHFRFGSEMGGLTMIILDHVDLRPSP
jgi:hypothetical protein